MGSSNWNSIFKHGMNFETSISVEFLKIYIDNLRYYRKGTFRVKTDLSNPKIKNIFYKQYIVLRVEEGVVTIFINCYMNRTLIKYINNFLLVLDINYELYLRRKQPRLKERINEVDEEPSTEFIGE